MSMPTLVSSASPGLMLAPNASGAIDPRRKSRWTAGKGSAATLLHINALSLNSAMLFYLTRIRESGHASFRA